MRQQQFQRRIVLEIDRPVDRIAPGDASSALQQQARAFRVLKGVVKRLAVIGVRARVEQQPRQGDVVVGAGGAIECRER